MEPLVYEFRSQKYSNKDIQIEITTNSWVYIWVDVGTSQIVYVGEYGKSITYNLIKRLKRSIGELSHGTMYQLVKNSSLTKYDLTRDMNVYCYQLAPGNDSEEQRKAIESWCNWLVATGRTLLHPQYCGFSYKGVSKETKKVADAIYGDICQRLSGCTIKS